MSRHARGRNDREVMNEILDKFPAWIGAIA
jgi:hypothetical protein